MNVVLIRFSSLGDCVLLCPLAARLAGAGARVTVVTKRDFVEIFAAATGVERIVALDPGAGMRGLFQIARSLRADVDVVIDAHNTWRSRVLSAMLGGASVRFEKLHRERLGLIVFKRRTRVPSMLERYGRLGVVLGDAAGLEPGGFSVPPAVQARCDARLGNDSRERVAFAPGSRWPMKRWPVDRYLELAARIVEGGRRRIVLVGDESDGELCRDFVETLGENVVDVTGIGGILDAAGHIARCARFVGNDSGLMHIAEALGVPVVALFGPTVDAFGYYPALAGSVAVERRLRCRPCSRNGAVPCPKGTQECMTEIPVDAVASLFADGGGDDAQRRLILE